MKFLSVEMQIMAQAVVVVEPGKQAGAEGVAGANGIENLNHRSWYADFRAGADPKGPVGPEGHDDQARAATDEGTRGRFELNLWVEPRHVGIARLDDRALRDDAV